MTNVHHLFGLILILGIVVPVHADPCPCQMPIRDMGDLVRMKPNELESLYRMAELDTVPIGSTRGRAIYRPGTRITVPASRAIHVLWKGKVFRDDGTMINRTLFGRAVTAEMSIGESWLDGKPSLILDYQNTTRLFRSARDEVRPIAPGLYLGIMYLRNPSEPELVMYFVLDDRPRFQR